MPTKGTARTEGIVNEADYMCFIVADLPFLEYLRACGLGPDDFERTKANIEEAARQEADAAYASREE